MREIVPCDTRAGLGRRTEGQSSLAFRETFAIGSWASHHDRSGCVGRDCCQAAMTPGAVMRGQLAFAQGTVTRRGLFLCLIQPKNGTDTAKLAKYAMFYSLIQSYTMIFCHSFMTK